MKLRLAHPADLFPWAAFAAAAALALFLFFPALRSIASICWEKDDYSHGLILPFISAYIIWQNRGRHTHSSVAALSTGQLSFSLSGLLLTLLGILFFLAGAVGNILFASWVGFFFAGTGGLVLALGWRGAWPYLPPFWLLFMAKPIPDSLVPRLFFPLQVIAARVSAWVLDLLDVPVYLLGNVIEIPGMKLMVEEACSGIRSLMALLSVALIVILLFEMRWWAKLLIAALAVLLAIALNVVRVAATGVLAFFVDPKAAEGFFHTFSGMVVFVAGLAILYFVATKLEIKAPQQPVTTTAEDQ